MAPTPASLHTVFTSECNNVQFDWFATGVFESFRTSGMRGKITRLLACSPLDGARNARSELELSTGSQIAA